MRLPAGAVELDEGPPKVPPVFAQAAVATLAPLAVLASNLDAWLTAAPAGWEGTTLLPADAGGRERAVE
eukprot:15443782-Alexandrium_andersonii.AAC.1